MIEKKISFKNSQNLNLIGSLWPADSDALIIMSHGSGSNRYANGRFKEIALALQSGGYNILSFDFSGHGESDDTVFNTAGSVEDVKAAITYAKDQGYKRIALFAHSFGAFSCLKSCPEVETMIFLGGVSGPIEWPWKPNYTSDQLKKIYDDGYITAPINDGLREVIKCGISAFDDIEAIDQKALLSSITCSVLMIHGDADSEERKLAEFSKKALSFLPKDSEVKIISGANHGFFDHIPKVIDVIKAWCNKELPL